MTAGKNINPFFTYTDIPDEFFCDRDAETEKIIKHIQNGSNIVLKSPRRLGKSSLIKHLFKQKEISKEYNTLYVDIYGTKNASDFQSEFAGSLLSAPFAKGTRLKKRAESLLNGGYVELGAVDPISGEVKLPRLGFSTLEISIMSLREMFDFLSKTKKPNLIVFDEFQQIQEYPERMAAILRSFVQESANSHYIFSGSSRHMLTTMFQISNQPFYKSAVSMDLDIIPMQTYIDFCSRMFARGHKKIEEDAVRFTYSLFSGETYLMQLLMKELYSMMPAGSTADIDDVKEALLAILETKDIDYKELIDRLDNQKERRTLFCIAAEGIGKELTSSWMMKKYNLDNASVVQNALNNLGEERMNIIARLCKGTYVLQDRLFELWIAYKSGFLDRKFEAVPERFIEQREIDNALRLLDS